MQSCGDVSSIRADYSNNGSVLRLLGMPLSSRKSDS